MKAQKRDYLLAAAGILLLTIGIFLVKRFPVPLGYMRALPYVCIGIGCGVFGQGMGNIISSKAVINSPALQKQMEIAKTDERNVAIASRAKSKAYDMMTFVFAALMLSYSLMGVDMIAVLLLVFSYLFVEFYGVYCRIKLEKEM